mgnify:CR=1 FL=1
MENLWKGRGKMIQSDEVRIRTILMRYLNITSDEIYKEEVMMDSLDIVEFIIQIEEEFGIEYNNFSDFVIHMDNIEDLVKYITCCVKEGR